METIPRLNIAQYLALKKERKITKITSNENGYMIEIEKKFMFFAKRGTDLHKAIIKREFEPLIRKYDKSRANKTNLELLNHDSSRGYNNCILCGKPTKKWFKYCYSCFVAIHSGPSIDEINESLRRDFGKPAKSHRPVEIPPKTTKCPDCGLRTEYALCPNCGHPTRFYYE